MPDRDYAFASITDLIAAYRAGDARPDEVVEHFLTRIDRLDDELHAYVTVLGEDARIQARLAQRRRADGDRSPLLGVPLSVKDAFHIRGVPTSLGSLVFRDQVAKQDSGVVRRLREAGAVFLGKTNTAEFGQSATTDNLLGRDTANPWDTGRTPGGSSGGAAASVAAGLATAAIGSDGGGSVRIPAAFTGLVGLKPTPGLCVDERGFRAMTDFVCPGPLTWSVGDARIILSVLAEQEHWRRSPDPVRVGYCAAPEGRPVDPEVADAVELAATALERAGHVVEPITLPIEGWAEIFGPLVLADEHRERGHLLHADGVQLTDYERASLIAASRLDPDAVSSASTELPKFRRRVAALFDRVDLLLTPAVAVPAFPLGQRPTEIADQPVSALWGAFPFAVPFNVAGTPAISLPCGMAGGLPVACQLVAAPRGEQLLLDVAEQLEDSLAFSAARLIERWGDESTPTSGTPAEGTPVMTR